MGAKELMAKLARRKEEAAAIAELWQSLFPEDKAVPDYRQISIWLNRQDFDDVVRGIENAAQWHNQLMSKGQTPEEQKKHGGNMNISRLIRIASGCILRVARKSE